MTDRPSPRIDQLDFIRGIAVMGILLANLPAFGLPTAAYFSPLAWGGHDGADRAAWFVTFVLIEGKMRAMFSLLFGASMLLVIDRAATQGVAAWRVHGARMAALFAIGCIHLDLIWWGDILTHYALVGMIALLFIRLPIRLLLFASVALLLIDVASVGAVASSLYGRLPASPALHAEIVRGFGVPPRMDVLAEVSAYRTSLTTATGYRLAHAGSPLEGLYVFGAQTLSAMLLGMAAYRSGFLTGRWSRAAYRRIAIATLVVTLPVYALLAQQTIASGFAARQVFLASIVLAPIGRPLTALGYVALALLAYRRDGAISRRVAAAGRAAFSNYLGTSILALLFFTVAHRFGTLSRADLYWLAPVTWMLMLAWSRPWLERFAYGPLEWAWRSLAGWKIQPFRRR